MIQPEGLAAPVGEQGPETGSSPSRVLLGSTSEDASGHTQQAWLGTGHAANDSDADSQDWRAAERLGQKNKQFAELPPLLMHSEYSSGSSSRSRGITEAGASLSTEDSAVTMEVLEECIRHGASWQGMAGAVKQSKCAIRLMIRSQVFAVRGGWYGWDMAPPTGRVERTSVPSDPV
jgi:hypothetical protein